MTFRSAGRAPSDSCRIRHPYPIWTWEGRTTRNEQEMVTTLLSAPRSLHRNLAQIRAAAPPDLTHEHLADSQHPPSFLTKPLWERKKPSLAQPKITRPRRHAARTKAPPRPSTRPPEGEQSRWNPGRPPSGRAPGEAPRRWKPEVAGGGEGAWAQPEMELGGRGGCEE